MPKIVKNDITGQRFGRLLVLEFIPDESDYAKFICRCDCGIEKKIMAQSIIRGATVSCGCFQKEASHMASVKHGHGKTGKKRHPTYSSWASMMDRCEWGGHKIMYSLYGAKGIRVFDKWHNFENFLLYMGERPKGTSIDRIDNTKGYFPGNCRWATPHQQALNTSRTVKVIVGDEIVAVYDLSEKFGLSIGAVRSRAARRNNDYVAALNSMGIECKYPSPRCGCVENPRGP